MRQPFVEGTRNPHLLSAILGGHGRDREKGTPGGGRAVERGLAGGGSSVLEPDLVEPGSSPIGEQADAVRAGSNRVEVITKCLERQVLEKLLADLELGHYGKRQRGHNAQRAK